MGNNINKDDETKTDNGKNLDTSADEVVGEIIDGILSQMVAKMSIEESFDDGKIETACTGIDQNLPLMHVIDEYTVDDSMSINNDFIEDDFIDIDELVNKPLVPDLDELWTIGAYDNDTLETDEIEYVHNLLEELSEQKNISGSMKRSHPGHDSTKNKIEEESFDDVDTFLMRLTNAGDVNLTEPHHSGREKVFHEIQYQNEVQDPHNIKHIDQSSHHDMQQLTVDHFINIDVLSVDQEEIYENHYFERKRSRIVTDGKLVVEPHAAVTTSGLRRNQDENISLQNLQDINPARCVICPHRQRIEKLINRRRNNLDQSQREEIISKKVKITTNADQETNMTLADIGNDVIQKYPNWNQSAITVPCYEFPGVKDRISWTEKDINDHISENFAQLKEVCTALITEMLLLVESKRAAYLAHKLLDLFSLQGKRVKDSYLSRISKILIENKNQDCNVCASSIMYFCEGQIEEYLRKSKPKIFGNLYNIRGKKAELSVKESNIRNLGESPGLVLTGLSNFKHLGSMLNQLGIKLGESMSVRNDVQSDSISVKPRLTSVLVQFDQVKSLEEKTWRRNNGSSKESAKLPNNNVIEKLTNHISTAFTQLEKDIRVFQDIFVFLNKEEWSKLDFEYFCCLPNSSVPDDLRLCEQCTKHIRSKEDFQLEEDLTLDEHAVFEPEYLHLYRKIISIYLGVGSMIELKTPSEGYEKEKKDLKCVSRLMFNYHAKRKIIMLGKEQMNLNYQRLENIEKGCVVLGPYGSGKTDALMFHFDKILDFLSCGTQSEIDDFENKSLILILVWEDKASDLKEYFKSLCKSKSYGSNIVIKVLSKSEVFSTFDIEPMDDASTTEQINRLCEKLQKVSKYSKTYVLIDEVTIDNPTEDLLGKGPFEVGGQIFGWANLNPGDIHLFLCVTPDSENFLEKNNYDPHSPQVMENNMTAILPTILLPRVYRSSNKIHDCMQNLQASCEAKEYVGYNFDPLKEVHGHEIKGETPIWIPLQASDHMICKRNKSCENCFLNDNLQKMLRKLFSSLKNRVPTEDITVILSECTLNGNRLKCIEKTKCLVKSWFSKFIKEDSLRFKFDFEFEGMDSPVVIVLRNNGDVRGSLSNCLSRATSKLIIVSPNDDQLLLKAKHSGAVKYLASLSLDSESSNHFDDKNSEEAITPNVTPPCTSSNEISTLRKQDLQPYCKEAITPNVTPPSTLSKEIRNRKWETSSSSVVQIHSRTPSPTWTVTPSPTWTVPQFPVQKYNYPPSPHSLPPSPFSPFSHEDGIYNPSEQTSSSKYLKVHSSGLPSQCLMGPPSPYAPIPSRPIKAPLSPFSLPPSPQSPAPPSPSSSSRRRKVGVLPPPPLFGTIRKKKHF